MSNDYFTATGNPTTRALGLSALIRTEFASIAAAFDKLPDPSSTGSQGFDGGYYSAPTIVNPTLYGGLVGTSLGDTYGSMTAYRLQEKLAGTWTPTEIFAGTTSGFGSYLATSVRRVAVGVNGSLRGFWDANGNFCANAIGTEIATNATNGFHYMPTTNGVATGVPAVTVTGALAMVYDRSNNKVGVYNGAWKWTAALT